MTVLAGRRLAAVGAKESYTITRPAPTEHSGLTTVLPTTEPGTSQIVVTVASGDFYLPAGLEGQYIGVLLAQVLNNDASSRTVSWRMVKNGSSVATGGPSVAATTGRARFQCSFTPTAASGDNPGVGVVAGDVIELRLWSASSTNVQLVYWTYFLLDTRTRPSACRGMRDVTITPAGASNYPALTSWPGGGAAVNSAGQLFFDDNATYTASFVATSPLALKAIQAGGWGLCRAGIGDVTSSNTVNQSISTSPTYPAANLVGSCSFRRVPVL